MSGKTDKALSDIGIESVSLMLADLPEVAEEWGEMPVGERVSWSSDWDQVMMNLPALERYYRSGKLSSSQEARYRMLMGALEDNLPLIERLNLHRPPARG